MTVGVLVVVRVTVGVAVLVGVGVGVAEGVKLERTNRVLVCIKVVVGRKPPGVLDVPSPGVGVQVDGKVNTVGVLVGTMSVDGNVGGLNGLRAE